MVNGNLIEIKGWHTELVDIKLASVTKPIKLMYKDDLKTIFDYVKNKTGLQIKNIFCLYENYVPEKRKCEWLQCNNEILVIPSKKNIRFCSKTCNTKYRMKNNKHELEYNKNPKKCAYCQNNIPYGRNINILKFCGRKCASQMRTRRYDKKNEYEQNS